MRANIGKSLALLTFGLVLSLVLAEVALRVVGVRFDASLYGDDPITGWRLRPNASGWWVSEGHAYVRINSVGMHDREYPLDKPADTVRIAVLGDSVTAAVQVDVRRNFTRVLGQRLAAWEAYLGKRVEAATLTTRFGEHPDDLIYGPPDVPEMREAWRVTEALILALFSEARSRGVKFWLVSLSQTPQHLPPKPREDVVKRRGIKDLFYPDRRLEAFARRHAIPALILAPRFAEYAARHDEPLSFGDGHYNEHGHRLVGDAIAERLCSGL